MADLVQPDLNSLQIPCEALCTLPLETPLTSFQTHFKKLQSLARTSILNWQKKITQGVFKLSNVCSVKMFSLRHMCVVENSFSIIVAKGPKSCIIHFQSVNNNLCLKNTPEMSYFFSFKFKLIVQVDFTNQNFRSKGNSPNIQTMAFSHQSLNTFILL